MRPLCRIALLISITIACVSCPGASLSPPADEEARIHPWSYDPAPAEAAAKIAFYEKMTRWSQEPTANELAMDATYYSLDLTLDPTTRQLTGSVAAQLRVSAAQSAAVDFDLAQTFTVTACYAGGVSVPFSHVNEILSITLDRVYLQDEIVSVQVDYCGSPDSSYGAFGWDSHNSQPMIWTLSEPFGARSWWPCDDWSDDKADSLDMCVTVPSGLIVASNGSLREFIDGATWDTYAWHEQYPIATYLVSLAIHPYTVWSDYYRYSETDSMEIQFFIYPDDYEETYEVNLMTKDMIAHFADVYGEYPFLDEKYGHAEFPWGGAMEHQTCTSTGAFYETIIAHELSHQWWGDMVTCADFHHIWLNEGFATYSEAVWLEHAYGPEGYWGKMNGIRYYGGGTIYVPDLSDWNRIFHSGLSYYKAAWVVHMLRHAIGEAAFWATLADYRATYEYSAATTEDLQAIAETHSGMDLSDFFQQWIYGEYFPCYGFTWANVETDRGWELQLGIDQMQTNTGYFHMPLDIRVEYEGGATETFVVDNQALAHQDFVLPLAAAAQSVALDPDDGVLKRIQEPIIDPTFHRPVLLVNGIDWSSYGTEATSAYQDRAFWGDLAIDFWDCFAEPPAGYPNTLPEPRGHGRVPSPILGEYETVIWVGNNYNGDLGCWLDTSILPYLNAGGNVLLLARLGRDFIDTDLRDYLGITWGSGTTVYDCVAVYEGLTNIARTGAQSSCAVFSQQLTQPTSALLWNCTQGYEPDVGIGVWRAPEGGGPYNPRGANFAFLSGRPYRWNHIDLRTNVQTVVETLFDAGTAVDDGPALSVLELSVRNPNIGRVVIDFRLPAAGFAQLDIFDAQGRQVRTLQADELNAGAHSITWNLRGEYGFTVPAGIYYARLRQAAGERTRPMLVVR